MKVRNLAILVLVLCVLCIDLSVYAEIPDPADCNTTYNLCENCDIETDISDSWTDTSNADVSWSTAQSRSVSHSLLVTVTNTTGTYGGESGCISLGRTTTTDDYYAAQAFVYASQSAIDALDLVRIRIAFYEGTTDCSGGQDQTIDIDLDDTEMTTDSWNKVSGVMSNVQASHQSAKVRLTQNNASASGSVSVYWDDVLFFQSNATAVTIRDFKVTGPESFPSRTFGLSAAVFLTALSLSALLWARRRRLA